MSEKYDYRLVSRHCLADLEGAARALYAEGWEIVNAEHGPTVGQVLQQILGGPGYGMRLPFAISMRRPVAKYQTESGDE